MQFLLLLREFVDLICIYLSLRSFLHDSEGLISTLGLYHRQQNKCYPKGVRLSEKLQLTAALCNEI